VGDASPVGAIGLNYKLAVHIGFSPFREASLLLNANELLILPLPLSVITTH
jgi:hypothetical protein